MPNSYQPEQWRDLFGMLGSSATALLGLLFVVLSIHLQTVKHDRDFSLRTRNNSYHLLNVFVVSALALAPQPAVFFGSEVALVSLYGLRLPIGVTWHLYRQDQAIRGQKPFWIGSVITVVMAYVLGIAGGAALVAGSSWGFALVALSCVVLMVRAVLSSWSLMFGVEPASTTTDP
jgi:hypothetical protein